MSLILYISIESLKTKSDIMENTMKLLTLDKNIDNSILNVLYTDEIIVYEDVQGSKLWVNFNKGNITIKANNLKNDSLNLVDLAMQKYYNHAIIYFNNLEKRVLSLLNNKWWFCFEYFPDEQPANILYDRIPKNHLVLTAINKNGKYNYTLDELKEYARLFDVDMLPILFQGRLSDEQIKFIKMFINTSDSDLEYVFGEKNFAYFFYKLLNNNSTSSYLMNDRYQDNIEKLIIISKKQKFSFEILNPLYQKVSTNNTQYVDDYTRLLLDFLSFSQGIDFKSMKLKGNTKDEVYLYLICKLFNLYMVDMKYDIIKYDIQVPDFFDKDKFKINLNLIDDVITKDYLKSSIKIEYLFKIILCSLNKPKKKIIGKFNENTLNLFNDLVETINDIIVNFLGNNIRKKHNNDLITYGDFSVIYGDSDASGNYYPDLYREIQNNTFNNKKKKLSINKK